MPELSELLTNDGKLMMMRAMGYSQAEIAQKLGITQPAISQRLKTIRKHAKLAKDVDVTFWEMLLGIGASHLLKSLFNESGKKS